MAAEREGPYVLGIDQGTSATKALLVDRAGSVVERGMAPVAEAHPRPGWVEQSPEEIRRSVAAAVATCLTPERAAGVAAVGLSNQRESLVLWERATGVPVGPVLSWQDQRTAEDCRRLAAGGVGPIVLERSGLPLDPMFSALKARWLLDTYDPDGRRSLRGELCLGTVDSWLLARPGQSHVIEVGNASRTQLLDIGRRDWDPTLLEVFGVPRQALPDVVPSCGPFPAVRDLARLPDGVPVAAVLGDSHAALFAHGCWRPGQVKATYGTGSSVMSVVGADDVTAPGLCRTVAWELDEVTYALEGNIRSTGATLRWLASLLGTSAEALAAAASADSEGVHLVPAFQGLGAPWWDTGAEGILTGLTLSTQPRHVARAALESIAFQVEDVVAAVEQATGRVERLLVDGGPTANPSLLQLQADVGGRDVTCPATSELSALGAAHLAGLAAGVWSWSELAGLDRATTTCRPRSTDAERRRRMAEWHRAVARARYGQRAPTDQWDQ